MALPDTTVGPLYVESREGGLSLHDELINCQRAHCCRQFTTTKHFLRRVQPARKK